MNALSSKGFVPTKGLFHAHRSRLAWGVLCGLVIAYLLIFGWLSLRRHAALLTALDLCIYDQSAWNTLHGRILRSTSERGYEILLADHVEPILLPISLLYLLHSHPQTLLLLQALVLALGALPLFALARERLGGYGAPLAYSLAYLLLPAIEWPNLFQFHPVALVPTFLLCAFLFLERRRWGLFFTFILLAMACKEEISGLIFLMGLYILFWRRERGVGGLTLSLGALWFYLAWFVIIGHFSPEGVSIYYAERYAYLGGNLKELVSTIISQPGMILQTIVTAERVAYLRGLLAPLAFTSLLSPEILFLSLPSLGINLLSEAYFMHSESVLLHYAAPIAPFVTLSSIYGVERLSRWLKGKRGLKKEAWVSLLSSLLYHRRYGLSPLSVRFLVPPVGAHERAADELASLIPSEAVVSAPEHLAAHTSQRETIYLYPYLEGVDYLLLDTMPTIAPIISRDFYSRVWELVKEEGFGLEASKDGLLLLKRGASYTHLSDDFYGAFRVDSPHIQYPLGVRFGDSLELLGFDLVPESNLNLYVYLDLYLRLSKPVRRELRLFTFLADEEGEIIPGTDSELPAAIWYPTSKWSIGQVVKVQTPLWRVDEVERLSVALGVVDGPNQWELESRLPPQLLDGDTSLSLLHGDTLLHLVTLRSDGLRVRIAEETSR